MSPSLSINQAINQVISIPPEELILPTLDGGTIPIPIPNSHIGKKPIHVRLLSSKRRIGLVNKVLIFPCVVRCWRVISFTNDISSRLDLEV